MLRILIAPDKFKGSLSSFEVCDAIEKGLRMYEKDVVRPAAGQEMVILKLPLSDGGDGLLEIISFYTDARSHYAEVLDPLSRKIPGLWLLSADGGKAFVEMAKASGLQLLKPSEYDCLHTTTYGTGQLIGEAIRSGAKDIMIGIGGSATNDGGMGMAAALGVRFLDTDGKELPPCGESLGLVAKIDLAGIGSKESGGAWPGVRFQVACDVQNPLWGPHGATRMYGPQKGMGLEMVDKLETGMLNYAAVIKRDLGIDLADRPGAGAAGGLGAGCMAFLGAELVSGGDMVMEYSLADIKVQESDLIITGEGRMDKQTLHGKLVAGIAALGKKYDRPVLALCGEQGLTRSDLKILGVDMAFSIVDRPMPRESAMQEAEELLIRAAFRLGSVLPDH